MGCVFWLGGRLHFSITTRWGRGQLSSASHIAFMQGEKKMVQSDLLTCCWGDCLHWSPAYAFLLFSRGDLPLLPSQSIRNQEQKLPGSESPASACSPAGSACPATAWRAAWKRLAIPKSSLCLYAATWGCIRRAALSSKPHAARRGTLLGEARSVIWAQPAPLSSTPPR